jgi:hypothetical protein
LCIRSTTSPRYDAAAHYHSFLNPVEVGTYLADKVLDVVDPTAVVEREAKRV